VRHFSTRAKFGVYPSADGRAQKLNGHWPRWHARFGVTALAMPKQRKPCGAFTQLLPAQDYRVVVWTTAHCQVTYEAFA